MARMSGGRAVVAALRNEEVTHAFGVIGTAMLEVFDALYESDAVTYVGVRHEQNAVHMADAYSRVRGRGGVVLAGQPGPGATNLVTGLAEARHAFSPVVAIAGDTASSQVDRDTFQEVDQQSLFTPVTKKTMTVKTAGRIPQYMEDAFRVAESGRKGPVVVNIPGDLLAAEIDAHFVPGTQSRAGNAAAPAPRAVAAAIEVLRSAERPLIVAGAGVKWARASAGLALLADKLNAIVAASAGHGDVLPADHPRFVGQIGPRGNPVATRLLQSADVVLALGTRLGYNSTLFARENISHDAKIIHVDIEPSAVARYYPVSIGIVADAGETIDALLAADGTTSATSIWIGDAQDGRRTLLAERAVSERGDDGGLSPASVYAALQTALPRDAIVTVDTGTISLHATDALQTFEAPSLLTPLDFGLVGFSYPAGLGAKAAAPHRPVVSIIGDGGFSMAMPELGTAIAAGLNTITVVLNNGCWGAEKAYQRDFFDGRYLGADLVNPRFDEIARAYGANGVRVESAGDVATALRDALGEDRPSVIEVPVDPTTITSFRRDAFPHRTAEPAGVD
jgi:thiamine pyrophosphate-dependent acetolactate synthase large subunit-like protein